MAIITVTVGDAVVAEVMATLPDDEAELLKRFPGAVLNEMTEEQWHQTVRPGTYTASQQQVDF